MGDKIEGVVEGTGLSDAFAFLRDHIEFFFGFGLGLFIATVVIL